MSDEDHTVGSAYHAGRTGDDAPAWARRISYLIAPDGTIARAYKVTDTAAHASEVVADLRALQAG